MFGKLGQTDTYSTVSTTKETWAAKTLLRPRTPPSIVKWPDPHLSIGQHRSSLRNQNFWDITGPALQKLGPLKAEVQNLLEKHVEHLKPDPKKTSHSTDAPLQYDLFMVGCATDKACPTLIMISPRETTRGRVIKLIKDSKLLEKSDYAGVLLGQCSRHPRYPKSKHPRQIAGDSGLQIENERILRRPVFIKWSNPKPTNGLRIYIPSEDPQKFRRATLGGFLDLTLADTTTMAVGMTVAHVFEFSPTDDGVSNSDEAEGSENDVFAFELDGPVPEGYCEDTTGHDLSAICMNYMPDLFYNNHS